MFNHPLIFSLFGADEYKPGPNRRHPQQGDGAKLKISLVPGWETRGVADAGETFGVLCRRGDTGDAVQRLQSLLGVQGPNIFGPRTEAAVREFQRQKALVPDGIVGPNTWKELEP